MVKVESPYDFEDESYTTDCSYIPSVIRVNYERKYQEPGVESMALGWGHAEAWRSVNLAGTILTKYNSTILQYKIQEKPLI